MMYFVDFCSGNATICLTTSITIMAETLNYASSAVRYSSIIGYPEKQPELPTCIVTHKSIDDGNEHRDSVLSFPVPSIRTLPGLSAVCLAAPNHSSISDSSSGQPVLQ